MSNYKAPSDMDYIEKNAGRYGWASLEFDDLISKFDVSRFPDYDNMPEPYISYIFMSRPDLNIEDNNWDVLRNHPMTALFMNDSYGQKLMKSMTSKSKNVWMPIITNRAMSYQVQDFNIKTIDKGNTFYGHMIKYGKHSEDHKVAGNFSIDFRNDRQLSIMKLMYLWMAYIYIISRTGDIVPRQLYEETGILDYPASLYYIVTRRNMREIVYAEKVVGIFPTSLPFSIFNYNDSMIIQDQLTIDFAYGIRCDPMDPAIFVDINYLSGLSYSDISKYSAEGPGLTTGYTGTRFYKRFKNNIVVPNSKEVPFAKGNALARVPFVHMEKSPIDSSIHYYLDFLNV